jgi:hypothetical protein
MRSNGTRKSDQGAVWRNIAGKAMRLKASSLTGAMSAIFESQPNSLEEFARAFGWQEGQCGVAFAIGGRVLGLEIFDHAEAMRRFFQKLARSYALDALDADPTAHEPATIEAVRMLDPGCKMPRLEWGRSTCSRARIESAYASIYGCTRKGDVSFLGPEFSESWQE